MLNLIHARTFLAVIEERGFRPAARKLALSPSTAIEHIRQLESDLAAPLLVRLRGQVEPTAQGAVFEPLARALVATAERAHELITKAPLRVAASSNVGIYSLQPAIARFDDVHGVVVEPWIGANPTVAERLSQGLADVAIMEWWDGRPGFEAKVWQREPLKVIVAPIHPWATRKSIKASELVGTRILGGEPGTGTGTVLRKHLGELANQLTTVDGYGSTEAVKRAVRAGHGISIVLASTIVDEIADGSLAGLDIEGARLEKDIIIVSASGLPETSSSARFVAFMLGEPE
ncbi:MAG: LysR family transcriptional regulator [Hyphomicrobiaceae bacterium]